MEKVNFQNIIGVANLTLTQYPFPLKMAAPNLTRFAETA